MKLKPSKFSSDNSMNISEAICNHIQDHIDNKGYDLKVNFKSNIGEDIISVSKYGGSWAEAPLVIYTLTDSIVIDIIIKDLQSHNQKISLLDENVIHKIEKTIDLLSGVMAK